MNGYVFFVEGPEDIKFLNMAIKEELGSRMNVIDYSEEPDGAINDTIHSMRNIHKEIVFISDYDYQKLNLFNKRTDEILNRYDNLNRKEIILASGELEAWIISGVPNRKTNKYSFKIPANTDLFQKQDFNQLRSTSNYSSDVRFRSDLLKDFSVKAAKKRNSSFKYFAKKLNL